MGFVLDLDSRDKIEIGSLSPMAVGYNVVVSNLNLSVGWIFQCRYIAKRRIRRNPKKDGFGQQGGGVGDESKLKKPCCAYGPPTTTAGSGTIPEISSILSPPSPTTTHPTTTWTDTRHACTKVPTRFNFQSINHTSQLALYCRTRDLLQRNGHGRRKRR
jgi:hypothetical protein